MQRIRITLAGCCALALIIIAGCSQTDTVTAPANQDGARSQNFFLQNESTATKNPEARTALGGTTYAYGLTRIYDANEGDYDWLVVFYLPYNPGSAFFQGSAPWGWQTYSGSWAQVYETRWVSGKFRIKILIGRRVTSICGTSAGDYRLVY